MKAQQIIDAVNDYYGVQILSDRRHHTTARARQVAMYLLTSTGRWSQIDVARILSRESTTVTYAVKKITESYDCYAQEIENIRAVVDCNKEGVMSPEFRLATAEQILNEIDKTNESGASVYNTFEKYMMLRGFVVATRSIT